jgi:hypothetical protein
MQPQKCSSGYKENTSNVLKSMAYIKMKEKESQPVEASPLRRGRKILLNIVENKKCRLPRLL